MVHWVAVAGIQTHNLLMDNFLGQGCSPPDSFCIIKFIDFRWMTAPWCWLRVATSTRWIPLRSSRWCCPSRWVTSTASPSVQMGETRSVVKLPHIFCISVHMEGTTHQSTYLPTYQSTYLPIYLPTYLSSVNHSKCPHWTWFWYVCKVRLFQSQQNLHAGDKETLGIIPLTFTES